MPLKVAKFEILTAWSQYKTITGFDQAVQPGKLQGTVTPTIAAGSAQQVLQASGTLAFGASVTFDVRSFTDAAFGQSVTGTGAYTIEVKGTGATWTLGPGASNPLTWFLGGTTPTIVGTAGAVFGYGCATAYTVDATNRSLTLTNTHGSATLQYWICIIVKTA